MSMDTKTLTARRPNANTSERILEVAERLVQTRGFNGFSYADIAAALGVTKASLHYHFASKAELGRQLIERYRGNFIGALHWIDRMDGAACDRLKHYVAIYERVLGEGRMCLCGMLAAEYATLPEKMRDALGAFFEANETWLATLLERGRKDGELDFAGSAREAANALTGALEGSMLVARAHGGQARFRSAATLLIRNFCGVAAKIKLTSRPPKTAARA